MNVCDYCGARMESGGQGVRDSCPNRCDDKVATLVADLRGELHRRGIGLSAPQAVGDADFQNQIALDRARFGATNLISHPPPWPEPLPDPRRKEEE